MRTSDFVSYLISHLSLVLSAVITYQSYKRGNYLRIWRIFFYTATIALILNIKSVLEFYAISYFNFREPLFFFLDYVAWCIFPILILWLGLTVKQRDLNFSQHYAPLLVIPALSICMILTSYEHSYFFIITSRNPLQVCHGPVFYLSLAYSVICALVGFFHLLHFSVRQSGWRSAQSLLLFVAIAAPIALLLSRIASGIAPTQSIITALFTFTLACCASSMMHHDPFKVVPIAAQQVVDLISDGFLVIDSNLRIIDCNQAICSLLKLSINDLIGASLETLLLSHFPSGFPQTFRLIYKQSLADQCTYSTESTLNIDNDRRFFVVEVTPVFQKNLHVGVIVLLKDVTQGKLDLETIKDTQSIMIERERLASLGQMVGGIAHNLKTPILSISGGVEALRDLTQEYDESIGDTLVTESDHHEIAAEMLDWLSRIQTHCSYISDVITTVKGQATVHRSIADERFTIDEFLKRIDLLMKHELKQGHCTLRNFVQIDPQCEIHGNVSSFVQIFDNLIINAVHAYEGNEGVIDLIISETADKLVLTLTDYATGIEPEVLKRLFKEMITTKGKMGTGLGLYLSHSTIMGMFNGQMAVNSELGKGTSFVITLPKQKVPDAANC